MVRNDGIVLQGQVQHRRTARLLSDLQLPGLFNGSGMGAGEVIHQAVFQAEEPAGLSYWCGPVHTKRYELRGCIRNDGDDAYAVVVGKGATWLITDLDTEGGPGEGASTPIRIEESTQDLAGAVDFAMVVRKVTKNSVVLEALVTQSGGTETLWKKALPLSVNGEAILPFWSHQLKVRPAQGGVLVQFSASGDGEGWSYEPVRE